MSDSPWRFLDRDGVRWMVRSDRNACWMVRLPDREVFLFEPCEAPAWIAQPAAVTSIQSELAL